MVTVECLISISPNQSQEFPFSSPGNHADLPFSGASTSGVSLGHSLPGDFSFTFTNFLHFAFPPLSGFLILQGHGDKEPGGEKENLKEP